MKSVGQIYEQEVQGMVKQTESLRKEYDKTQRAYARLTKKDDTNGAFGAYKDMRNLTERIGSSIEHIDRYRKLSYRRRDVYGPRYTKNICLYHAGATHPRIAAEFDFFKKDGSQVNTVELSMAFNSINWQQKTNVWPWKSMTAEFMYASSSYVRYVSRDMKSFAIDRVLLPAMLNRIDWFREIKKAGYVKRLRDLYDMLEPHIGKYVSISWHNNVLCGCAYDRERLYICTSTSDPNTSWVAVISKTTPVLVFENNIYVLSSSTHFPRFTRSLAIRYRESITFNKRPRAFRSVARRKISHEAINRENYEGFIKQSWERRH